MNLSQFRVLYRQFLFRMVDLELLSPQAQGDIHKLFGQIASLMVSQSVGLAMAGLTSGGERMAPLPHVLYAWSWEHFLISLTMLAVGVFAVLAWDSAFPDKRDVMALGPLPVQAMTLFLAKAAGVAMALSIMVFSLHSLSQLTWPTGLAWQPEVWFEGHRIPARGGFGSYVRTLGAYWATMFASGAFMFCCVLGVQGIAAQLLPRRVFLRVSGGMQLALFGILICGFLLEPLQATPRALAAAQGDGLAAWQFSFWFLGLFQQLSGSPALPVLAHRAWLGLAVVTGVTAVAYTLSYMRTLRKIIEDPDITPSAHFARWLPPFGNQIETAIGQFSVRSLLRSRQHRVIFAFYLGVGFAINTLFLSLPVNRKLPDAWVRVNPALMATTVIMVLLAAIGARIVFAMPLDLRANWIFRMAPVYGGVACLRARRRALLVAGLLPVWLASAAMLFHLWPWQAAVAHLTLLGLLGAILAELCLRGFQRIPCTCSYLPGKTNIHVTFIFGTLVILQLLEYCAVLERQALDRPMMFVGLVGVMAGLLVFLRWRAKLDLATDDAGIQFVDEGTPAVQSLGLNG
jgi:hypothetical protein